MSRSGSRTLRNIRSVSIAAITAVALLVSTPPVTNAGVPPGNDDFADRVNISALPFSDTRDMIDSTVETGEPNPTCTTAAKTVWYRYKPATTSTVSADTIGSDFEVGVAVYTGTSLITLSQVDCNLETTQNQQQQSRVAWRAVAGTVYFLQVTGMSPGGALVLHVKKVTPPANDAFASARTVGSLPFSASLSNRTATVQSGEPTPSCSGIGATLWYKFKPTSAMTVQVDTLESDFDSVVAVYRGTTLGGLTQIDCDDDVSGGFSGYQSSVAFKAAKNQQYYLQVGGYNSGSGQVSLRVRKVTPPTNDDFAHARNVTAVPFIANLGTRTATLQAGEPHGSCVPSATGATVWYKRTASDTGTMSADTATSTFNVAITVWEGSSLGSLSEVDCRSSAGSLSWPMLVGHVYYIQAGGNGEPDSGALQVRLEEFPGP